MYLVLLYLPLTKNRSSCFWKRALNPDTVNTFAWFYCAFFWSEVANELVKFVAPKKLNILSERDLEIMSDMC